MVKASGIFLTLFTLTKVSLGSVSGLSCEKTVEQLRKENNLKITYILGYKDARPARFVGDRYEKNVIAQKLLQSCRNGELLCGFQRQPQDAYLFIKDGKQKIQLRLLNSSMSEDDDENRNHPFQKWLSVRVRKEFLISLYKADILFYNGHSRSGGGPDFFPPLIKKDQQVDFPKYKNGHGSFATLLNYFKKVQKPLSVLGLFSCKATQHFEKDLSALQKNVMLLTAPHLIYFKEALDKSLLTLEHLLQGDCEKLKKWM